MDDDRIIEGDDSSRSVTARLFPDIELELLGKAIVRGGWSVFVAHRSVKTLVLDGTLPDL